VICGVPLFRRSGLNLIGHKLVFPFVGAGTRFVGESGGLTDLPSARVAFYGTLGKKVENVSLLFFGIQEQLA
jgi:hypothetical protein